MKLQPLIEQYLAFRQMLGARFRSTAEILRSFSRALGPETEVGAVTSTQIEAFLIGAGATPGAYRCKYCALLGLYRYAQSRGYVTAVPLPARLLQQPTPFVPYIYSNEELRRLVEVANSYQHPLCRLEPLTMRTIVLLLYGAALRVSEAVNLNRADVDLHQAVLTIRQSKFFKTRLVPFGQQLGQTLAQYAQSSRRSGVATDDQSPFFTLRTGTRVKTDSLQHRFRLVCAQAGIRRSEGARYQPRLHDLRHSFAVHRLTSWYRQGKDVQKLLPQLSVYLGHTSISHTQVYLSMTPELLAEASARFERYVGKEGSHD
jgi:integrase/recombinase XerD